MFVITFSDVCKAFEAHAKTGSMSVISRRLLKLITDQEGVLNDKGEKYRIQNKELIELFKGELDIFPNIRKAAKDYKIIPKVDFDFEDACYDLVEENDYDAVQAELTALVNADTNLSASDKERMLNARNGDLLSIGPSILLYSLQNNNNTKPKAKRAKKPATIEGAIDALKDLIARLPKPVAIEVPEEISATEMVYVSAILDAFAEDAGVSVISQGDLIAKPEYSKYKQKFDRYRTDYYKAESIKESLKDTKLENEDGLFEKLEEDMYGCIIDKVEDDYPTSYERMTSVLEHVTKVELSSLLAKIPDLVGSSQKKGLCHILVNEERIKWKS